MQVLVVNQRSQKNGFYVGRPTVLGNPFQIGVAGEREKVIEKYRYWLAEKLLLDSPQRLALEHLAELLKGEMALALACWCAPEACHADVIREVVVARSQGKSWETIHDQLVAVSCA
jgi:hypothetical protein